MRTKRHFKIPTTKMYSEKPNYNAYYEHNPRFTFKNDKKLTI